MHVTMGKKPSLAAQLSLVVISCLHLMGVAMGVSLEGQSAQSGGHREKRNVLQLCELIARHTSRGCMDYNNYGCFCGLGNAASHHVDAVDGCCRVHDRCYGRVSCYWFLPQFVGYNFRCEGTNCTCTDSNFMASCARSTCECDLALARCLQRTTLNRSFINYDREQCNRPRSRIRRGHRKAKRSWAKAFYHALKSRLY